MLQTISSAVSKMEDSVLIMFMVSSMILLSLSAKAFYSLWWKPKRLEKQLKQLGIKGTSYKFFGDQKLYARLFKEAASEPMDLSHNITMRVVPFISETVKTYGNISLFWFGTRPTLVIADPKLTREVLSDKCGHVQKPQQHQHIKHLTMGLSTMEGDTWAKRRNLVTPAFHIEKLKGMRPALVTSCSNLIKRWEKLTSHQRFCETDVWPDIQNFTAEAISRTAFGGNFEQGKMIFELQKEQVMLVTEARRSLHLPGFRFIPTKKNKRRTNIALEIRRALRNLIQRKMDAIRIGDCGADDLLGMLLHYGNRMENSEMTIDEVIEECKLFYLAGQETTSSLLTWTLIVLALHPTWQEKARDEILIICGKNAPSFENMNQLKMVTMILYEVLRLYPPAVQQYRYTTKETKIGDLSLPAGVQIMLSTLLVHHDSKIWGEDAEEFKPERFSEGILNASMNQLAFFPFGWGPRICLGQNFALMEAKMALVMILLKFSFQLSPSYVHAPHTVMALQPQHGARIILHAL